MLETSLAIRSALASVAAPGHHDAAGTPGVKPSELSGLPLAALTARDANIGALSAAMACKFGAPLPSSPGRVAQGSRAFIWSGRNQWLAIGGASGEFMRGLTACAGERGDVTDLTGSRAIVRISGLRARDGLMKLLPVDLGEEAFSAGSAASTVAVRVPVQIWQINAAPTYEMACPRSYGISLWQALVAAFTEYGCETGG